MLIIYISTSILGLFPIVPHGKILSIQFLTKSHKNGHFKIPENTFWGFWAILSKNIALVLIPEVGIRYEFIGNSYK